VLADLNDQTYELMLVGIAGTSEVTASSVVRAEHDDVAAGERLLGLPAVMEQERTVSRCLPADPPTGSRG
jgi:hypothetical protein